MSSQLILLTIFLLLNVVLIYVLMGWKVGERVVSRRTIINADRDDVWQAVFPLGRHAADASTLNRIEPIEGVEDQATLYLSHEDRTGEPIARRIAFTELDAGNRFTFVITDDTSLKQDFWNDFSESAEISGEDGAVELKISQRDSYSGYAFPIIRYFGLRRQAKRVKQYCETGRYDVRGLFERPSMQVVMAGFSAFLLWPLFGLNVQGFVMALMLTTVIALHELGHMAAFRLSGHPTARMIFIPLLGGVAIGSRPYDRNFEVAFCALMGPGMSAFLTASGIALYPLFFALEAVGTLPANAASLLIGFVLFCGAFNFLNLVPMWKFDGGQVVRQIFETNLGQALISFVCMAAMIATGVAAGMPVYPGIAIGLLLLGVSMLSKGRRVRPKNPLTPMNGTERLSLIVGYGSILAIHGYGVVWAIRELGALSSVV